MIAKDVIITKEGHKITLIPEIGWVLVRRQADGVPTGAKHEFIDSSRLYCKPLQDGIEPTPMSAREMTEYMMKTHSDIYEDYFPVYRKS